MNSRGQLITMFFLVMLIITILAVLSVEYYNLSSNKNGQTLTTSFTVLRNGYSSILSLYSQLNSLNVNSSNFNVLNSTITNMIKNYLVNYNFTYRAIANNLNVLNSTPPQTQNILTQISTVPITLQNTQSVATADPYQQKIMIDSKRYQQYEASNLQNVEFFYANGSVISSWLEIGNSSSKSIYWLKLGVSIPAHSSITIYMGFAGKSTNLFNGVTVGEAPQLSAVYGKYDNGANVFENYFNAAYPLSDFLNQSGYSISRVTINCYTSFCPYGSTTAIHSTGTNARAFDYARNINLPNQAMLVLSGAIGSSTYLGSIAALGAASMSTSPAGINYVQGNGTTVSITWLQSGNFGGSSTVGGGGPIWDAYQLAYVPGAADVTGSIQTTTGTNSISYQNYIPSTGNLYFGLATASLNVQENDYVDWMATAAYPPNGVMPSAILTPTLPQYIGYYAPVSITNDQPTATPAPFQQQVVINATKYQMYEASNLQNVEFFYANGSVIPSWLESGTSSSTAVYWLKLGNGIPANTTINAYIGFADPSINLFNGINVGEAPQLSPAYGQYDNGGKIFINYWNFSGSSVPFGFSTQVPSGASITVNNGITFSTGSANNVGIIWGTGYTPPVISEAYITSQSGGAESGGIAQQNGNLASSDGYDFNEWSGSIGEGSMSGGMSGTQNINLQIVVPGVNGQTWTSSSAQYYYKNYESFNASSGDLALPSSVFISTGVYASSTSNTMTVQWMRVRAYPPNDVMPSINIGQVSGGSTVSSYGYQYSVANFTNASNIAVPGTASTAKIWNGGDSYTLSVWVNLKHAYGNCNGGFPCNDLLQENQGCTSGLQQFPDNSTGYFINLVEWNQSCGTGANDRVTPNVYVPYNKWVLVTGILKYNSPGNAWIASCADLKCSNSTYTLNQPAPYATPATELGSSQMNGQTANVQMYDTALSLLDINHLYNAGIGAEPVHLEKLIAWLPLDGNGYDYSNNSNNGALTSIAFLYPNP